MIKLKPALLCLPLGLAAAACVDEPRLGTDEAEVASVFETSSFGETCTPPHLIAAAPGEEGQWAAAPVAPTSDRAVTVNIGTRLPIAAHDYIYVAIEMVGDPATDSGYNCVAGCGPQTANVNWWSLLDGPPFNWVTFSSVGISGMDMGVRASGAYL